MNARNTHSFLHARQPYVYKAVLHYVQPHRRIYRLMYVERNVRVYKWTYVQMYKRTNVHMAAGTFCRVAVCTNGFITKRQDGAMYTRTFVQTALWLKGHTAKGTQGHTAYSPFIRMDITPDGRTAGQPFGLSAVQPFGSMVHDRKPRTRKKNGKMCFCTYKLPFARTKTTCHLRPVAAETIAPKSQSDGINAEKNTI